MQMYLKQLRLKNFRNFREFAINWHPEFNFIFGRNAQGKTNLLEAIYYLSQLKSFRTTDRSELIMRGTQAARIQASLKKDDLIWEIELTLSDKSRQILLNQKKPKSRKEYHELLPVILFEPRNIYLFRDAPSERRRYLNSALFLQSPGFLALFAEYEKILAQKNKLLKETPDFTLLEIWNERLISVGAQITWLRWNWFQKIKKPLFEEYEALSQAGQKLQLIYQMNCMPSCPDAAETLSQAEIAQEFSALLQQKRSEEMRRGESIVGPHRDDFKAFLDDRHLGRFGSQGENRSAIIALKLAQLKLYTQRHQKTPIFLLDDVASELDEQRCAHLFSYLARESTQVFITTTENRIASPDFTGHFHSFLVEEGRVEVLT